MRSFLVHPRHQRRRSSLSLILLSVLLAGSLVATPWLFAASPGESSHEGHATPVALPGWTQQLKGQTILEDTIEGNKAGLGPRIRDGRLVFTHTCVVWLLGPEA